MNDVLKAIAPSIERYYQKVIHSVIPQLNFVKRRRADGGVLIERHSLDASTFSDLKFI